MILGRVWVVFELQSGYLGLVWVGFELQTRLVWAGLSSKVGVFGGAAPSRVVVWGASSSSNYCWGSIIFITNMFWAASSSKVVVGSINNIYFWVGSIIYRCGLGVHHHDLGCKTRLFGLLYK